MPSSRKHTPSYTKVFTTKHKVGKEKQKRTSERREQRIHDKANGEQ